MAAKQNLLGLVDTGREIGRSPLVGMEFLHQRAVRAPDGIGARARLQAKDLIGLLFRHFSATTPQRRPAVASPCACSRQPGSRRSRYATNSARLSSSNSASRLDQRRDVERSSAAPWWRPAMMLPAHLAAVVVELHVEKGRAHARGLPGALSGAVRKAGRPERQPAEQSEPEDAERNGDADFAAQAEEHRKAERQQCRRRP